MYAYANIQNSSFLGVPIFMGFTPFQHSEPQNFGSNKANLSLQNHANKLPNPLKPSTISNASKHGHFNFKPNNYPSFVYPLEI
jgi:hypothetical protein